MKFHLTSLERRWVLYDVANSAFTMMVSTIIPIYFNALAGEAGISRVDYLAYWGYAVSVSTLITALAGPFVGAASDRMGRKKPIFTAVILAGAALCFLLGWITQWLLFLFVFILAKSFYSISLVIYDSTLSDVTEESRMDDVSSQGYAWGYIGSCIPFIACLLLVLSADKNGLGQMHALMASLMITAVWWLLLSLPLLRAYRQRYYLSEQDRKEHSRHEIVDTLKEIGGNRRILLFLAAFFFYIDGVYTIIDMSTAYGTALGLGSTDLLLALLVTQFVAFPSAILMGKLSRTRNPVTLISACILAYVCIAVFAVFLAHAWQFWVLAIGVGMFQGGIQALSRSYYTKIIPKDKSGAYFGIYDICGKGASLIGTAMVGLISQLTGRVNLGVAVLAVFFAAGLILFRLSAKAGKPVQAGRDRAD